MTAILLTLILTGKSITCPIQFGISSYYHDMFQNRRTSSQEIFKQHKLTAAHRTLPLNSKVYVLNLKNFKGVLLKVNDRGPFAKVDERIIDVTSKVAVLLDFKKDGLAPVMVINLGQWIDGKRIG